MHKSAHIIKNPILTGDRLCISTKMSKRAQLSP